MMSHGLEEAGRVKVNSRFPTPSRALDRLVACHGFGQALSIDLKFNLDAA